MQKDRQVPECVHPLPSESELAFLDRELSEQAATPSAPTPPELDPALLDQVSFSSLFADDDDAAALFKLDGSMIDAGAPRVVGGAGDAIAYHNPGAPALTATSASSPYPAAISPSSEAGLAAATEDTFHDALFGGFAAEVALQQQQQQQQPPHRSPLVAEVEELGPGPDQLTPHWDGVIPHSFWDLEEELIALISYKDLAKLMAKSKLTAKQIEDAKKLRRRVKNRQSARVCSTRKRVKCHSTESTNAELYAQLTLLQQQNQVILAQHTLLQDQLLALQKSEQEAVAEKLAMEADVARMQTMLDEVMAMATAGPNGTSSNAEHQAYGLSSSLFAIAA